MGRERFYDQYEIGGIQFMLYPGVDFIGRDFVRHTVVQGERIDLLAYQYYDDPDAWWIIGDANGDMLPMLTDYTGQKIMIPAGEINDIIRKR